MKKYLLKFLLFCIAFCAVLAAIGFILPYNNDGYVRAQIDKMAYLAKPDREPTIVILGGSNAAFGYDTKVLNDSLPMPVFNAGLHAGMGMKFFLDDCSQYLKKRDILVFSPEYAQFFGDLNDGQAEFTDIMYLYHMKYPGKMSRKQIISIMQNTPSYLKRKIEYNLFELAHLKSDPVYTRSSVNEYGDVTWHWYKTRKHGTADGKGMSNDLSDFNEDAFLNMISKLKDLSNKGVRVLVYPPAYHRNAFDESTSVVEYLSNRFENEGFNLVCNPAECTFDAEMFYDTNYHLNHEGALSHNKHLISILRNSIQ